MNIITRNTSRDYLRNGKLNLQGVGGSYSSSYNGGGMLTGNYLPAVANGDGTYTVDLSKVVFNGSVIAAGEVTAYDSGESGGSTTTGNVTIYDGLDSVAADVALSANQGRVLKGLIDDVADIDLSNYYTKTQVDDLFENRTVEDVDLSGYYKKTEVDSLLAGYVSLTNFNNHTGDTTKHITSTERTNWNKAYTNNHTHSNKTVLDGITSTKVSNWDSVYTDWNKAFYFDSDGNLRAKLNLIGEKEVSAYGAGETSSGGVVTIVDNLTSTATDAALSANQGRYLKSLIDNIDVGTVDLTGYYSKTQIDDMLSNYSKTSHTHSISSITNLQTTLDGKAASSHSHNYASTVKVGTTSYNSSSNVISLPAYPTLSSLGAAASSHTHSQYYDSAISRTKNTVLAAPNGSAGSATFRALVAADIPTLAISKISGLQTALDGKAASSHTHNYAASSHTHSYASSVTVGSTKYSVSSNNITIPAYPTLSSLGAASSSHTHNYAGSSSAGGAATSANKVNSALSWSGYSSGSYDGSAAKSITIPSNTNQLTNGAGYITSSASISGNAGSATKLATSRTLWGQSFNGTANVSGAMTGVTTITASGAISCASLKASGEVTAHSDRRLKTDIRPLEIRGELNPVTYVKDGKKSIGFIADEVKEVYPELVVTDESTDEKYLSLNYAQLTAVLYAEIKELKNQIRELNEKVRIMAN